MKFLYCHGFASGPQSRKARTFKNVLAGAGIELLIPALDSGDFEHLTVSGQLKVMEEALSGEPARLLGSSMGGYLAALYASLHPEVDRLVLLAPAFEFAPRWRDRLASTADFEVFHYGTQSQRRVHYGLIQDALRFPAMPDFDQPALVFHGVDDDVVPVALSRAYALTHPNASLVELASDHELLDVLPQIVENSIAFLTAAGLNDRPCALFAFSSNSTSSFRYSSFPMRPV